ncbi:MAG: DoxX family protein [Pseudomonadota bacterium]
MISFINFINTIFDKLRAIDFLAPLALRLYLAPIFILAGMNKLSNVENVASWFEWLGFPAPTLMVWLAGGTELIGGIFLLVGFGVRWAAIPLLFTMAVAASTHWENGWHALPETELTVPWEWETEIIEEANERKDKAKDILREHGNYKYLTEYGSITILKNGIEFAATYFVMLLALFFMGSGKYLGIDYYLARMFRKKDDG